MLETSTQNTNNNSSEFYFDKAAIKSKKTKEKLGLLKEYRYPDAAKTKLRDYFPFTYMDDDELEICITEWKRFIGLIVIRRFEKNSYYKNANRRVAMTSELIDQVWHVFIMFSIEYHNFSMMLFGEYLHHVPADTNSPITDYEVRLFIQSYRMYYGTIHPVWYYKLNKASSITSRSSSDMSTNGDGEKMPNYRIEIPILSNNKDSTGFSERSWTKLGLIEERGITCYLTLNSIIYTVEAIMLSDVTDTSGEAFAYSEGNNVSNEGAGEQSGEDQSSCSGCGGCGGG